MKILTNSNIIFGQIEKLIEKSNEFLYLVSPFIEFEMNDRDSYNKFKKSINLAIQKNIEVNFISRKPDNNYRADPEEKLKQFLDNGCNLYLVPNLHSKIFCNESKALITSMNMYMYSVINNEEIGVKISKKNEKKEYEGIIYYIEKLKLKTSKAYEILEKSQLKEDVFENDQYDNGYCILCHDGITFNRNRPLCYNCFNEFKQFKPIHGKFCHKCGKKDHNVDQYYPLCYSCFQKSKAN